LPQKTLASIEWVHRNTPYAYMLKIDDDCFIDVDEFFHSLSYRKFDYYGRRLHRQKGQLDRTWHILKSTTDRGLKELDKSPEPSEYADGGSGYVLSRKAMEAISKAHASPTGQQLIADSFMEDKMIGDLLKQQGISISDEDFYVNVERRTFSNATPVSMWQNAFYAGLESVVKVVHLDTHKKQDEALKLSESGGLFPKKIWPTHDAVSLGYNTNLLELLSDQTKLAKLNAESLAVVACMRNEMFMLPHFLRHYRELGVKSFLIADNCSDDGTREYLMEQPDVAVFSVDTDYSISQYGVSWQMNIVANLRVGRWSLIADADELLVFRGWERKSLPKLLNSKDWKDVDAVRIYMLDMYPEGPLSETTFEKQDPFASAGFVDKEPFIPVPSSRGPYSNSPTVTSALRHRLIPRSRPDLFVAQKYALMRYMPWMRPSAGFHYVAEQRVAEQEMIFAHFKYTAQFRQKAVDEVARGQHFNDAEEYRKYLDLMSEGREVIFKPGLSVPWRDCDQVRRILDA